MLEAKAGVVGTLLTTASFLPLRDVMDTESYRRTTVRLNPSFFTRKASSLRGSPSPRNVCGGFAFVGKGYPSARCVSESNQHASIGARAGMIGSLLHEIVDLGLRNGNGPRGLKMAPISLRRA